MFCKSCGTSLANGAKFCSTCGATVEETPVQQPVAASTPPVNTMPQQPYNAAPQQPYNAAPQQPYNAAPQQPYNAAPQQPNAYQFNNQGVVQQLPMNWFKFVIYFQLFANAVLNIVAAVLTFTGSHYGGGYSASLIYAFYPNLKTIDIIYGIFCIVLACIAIFARFRLAAFKKDAITWLMTTYAANIIVPIIYVILVASTIGVSASDVLDASSASSIVTSTVLIICSSIYFNKRKHMFVN